MLAAMPLVAALSVPAVVPVPAGAQTTGSELCDTTGVERFSDVQAGDYAADYVLCMRALGLSRGLGDGSYGADDLLKRGQMAAFLVRLWTDTLDRECPTGAVAPFTDTAGTTHAASIDCIYGLGITAGVTATEYRPQETLKASQISRFLFRTYEKAGSRCPTSGGPELEQAVSCLLDRRVVPTETEAAAATPVTRSQMAVYVIGLWHNLTGRGLPPPPPQLGEPTTRRQPVANLSPLRLAYTAGSAYRTGPWSPDSTKILYYAITASGERDGELWVVNTDGTNRRQLAIRGSRAVWSPDGARVIYEVGAVSDDMWVVGADGTGKWQLSAESHFEHWSPDGARILFNDGDGLWVVGADGTGKQYLSSGSHSSLNFDLGWSPDGARILYRDGDGLWVVGADGTGKQQVGSGRFRGWSPDSSRVLYHERDRDGLWVMDADGTGKRQLTAAAGRVAVWSPDSTRVLYHAGGPSGSVGAMWVVNADGTNQRRLATAADEPMVWSPDSTKITYNGGNDRVWVVDADGTDPLQIVYARCQSWYWPADSTKILYVTDEAENRAIPPKLWVVDVDGTNRKRVVDFGRGASFAPDSARVAYIGPLGALWVVDADGTNRIQLTTTRSVWVVNSDGSGRQQVSSDGRGPQWSPDGTRLAFADSDGYRVLNPDGTVSQSLGGPGSAELTWSPDGTKIAYVSSLSSHLVFANADGTRLWPSYSGPGTSVRWSPDSARVTFQRSYGFWVMNADGTNLRQLNTEAGSPPVWSPDGTRLAFPDHSDAFDRKNDRVLFDRLTIWVANANGTKLYSVNGYGPPRWSSDGARLYYKAFTADDEADWIMNADGTNRRQLPFLGSVSPDLTRIARADDGIWVTNTDGTNGRQLTDQQVSWIEWSPDGTRILYAADGIWVTNTDGTSRRQLTDQEFGGSRSFRWSPDGTSLFYVADGIWVANADGTSRRQLTDQDVRSEDWASVWSPDSTRIAYMADGLWVVNADGTNRTQLTEEGAFPRWAPLVVW